GYWVASPGSDLSEDALRRALGEALPEYMVPSALARLDSLPRSSTGKIDRRSLPAPVWGTGASECSGGGRAPETETERRLAALWCEVLERDEVGADEDFFELGGHSLSAVRLMNRVGEVFRPLPLAELFQHSTVARLAQVLDARPEVFGTSSSGASSLGPTVARASSVVPLQTVGDGPPVVLIHPAGGTVFCYRALAQKLGSEELGDEPLELQRPVYGVQAPEVEGELISSLQSATSLESMAESYMEALMEHPDLAPVVRSGDWTLGGWSMGGLVAYEIALQLHHRGLPVPPLALVDAWVRPARGYAAQGDLVDAFLRQLGLPPERRQRVERAVVGDIPGGEGEEVVEGLPLGRLFTVFRHHARLWKSYRPRPWPVGLEAAQSIVLWQAEEIPPGVEGRAADGWRDLGPGLLEIRSLPGDHFSCLEGAAARRLVAAWAAEPPRRAAMVVPEGSREEG
ncbi:MAG: thioesterase domain-containing protein, partial [Acidobacteriota bacterium]|nr:thioesterase domain-containing protein [Acidobacteriota bacterium]